MWDADTRDPGVAPGVPGGNDEPVRHVCAQAARSLPDTGWPVRVIEARDRIGGRVHIDRDWGVPLEMGGDGISPVQVRTSRWNLDPYARGAYSLPRAGLWTRRPPPRAGTHSVTGSTWPARPSASTIPPACTAPCSAGATPPPG